jgi:hypothetical protein
MGGRLGFLIGVAIGLAIAACSDGGGSGSGGEGTTVLARDHDSDGLDPRLTHTITAAGAYYLAATDLSHVSGEDFSCTLRAE